ncbi:MAG: EAL domain-containing protein [Burkholderiaceae bacterium]|nr:EAL domain-containing protein [Burkholderiaceae bacterium]
MSLHSVATRLIFGAAAAVAALVAGLAWAFWSYGLRAEVARQAADARAEYAARLAEQRQGWQRAAHRLRSQIEFLRLGELEPSLRQARLQAFFTAQGEHRDFAGVLLARHDGQALFTTGCRDMLMQGAAQLRRGGAEEALARDTCESGLLYALLRVPLWLGAEGRGHAVFAVALDNGTLRALAQGEDNVYLLDGDKVVAASGGFARLQDQVSKSTGALFDGAIQVALPVGAADDGIGATLVVRRPLALLISARELVGATALAALLVGGFVWAALGPALRRQAARLQALTEGAEAFCRRFQRDASWARVAQAARAREDEIARLCEALDALMEEAEQRQREQRAYQKTLDQLDEVVLELDQDGRLVRASNAWPRVMGAEPRAGERLVDLLEPEDGQALAAQIEALARGTKDYAGARLRLKAAAGEERWVELRLAGDGDGRVLRGVLRDMTTTYLQQRRITHMALHDALTGLPNRVLLEDRMKMALRLAARNRSKVALGFIDLDHFKNVNDSLGHRTGDALLVGVAKRLGGALRASDTLARWGGDEFVVLLPDLPDGRAAGEVVAKLRQVMATPLPIEDGEFLLTFSAGFALYPDDGLDGETLLACADRAMFHAKAQGRNAVQFFADMTRKGLGRQEIYLQQRLAAAVREGRIVNHYQPVVDARSRRVVGVETLARWYEEGLGWVPPATFIPMAESLGLIRELGERVWRAALSDARRWQRYGLQVAINVSKRQLFEPAFVQRLLRDVAAQGLAPSAITLEITESVALMEVENCAERLRELAAAGFRLAIDDFGTGYSSLAQLHELPVHDLKIDSSFVRRVHTPQGARLVGAILALADSVDLATVAEGVEDEDTARLLAGMGVCHLQGWHFGRPMPAAEISAWLAQDAADAGKT